MDHLSACFLLLPTAESPPLQGHQDPCPLSFPSTWLPCRAWRHLPSLPAIQGGSANCLPVTAERSLRSMAHDWIVSKGNLDGCLISGGFCCILCLPRCHLRGPRGALCPSAPAHCQARLALRATILYSDPLLNKHPAGSHACKGASFLLSQGMGKEETWLFPVPMDAARSADTVMLHHGTSILHIPNPSSRGFQAPE